MANDNTKLQYIVELLTQGDTKRATDELNKLNKVSEGASKGLDSATASAKQLFAFLGGTALIMESLGKFLEAERGINALNYALEQTKNNAPGVRDAILEMAEALGDDFKVQADDVIKVMTQLLSFGANPKDLKRLTEFVYDLSEVMGRDVPRAARQMSQALRGNFEVFNALGIEVDKTKTATEGFNEAIDKGGKMISGRTRAAVKGVAGDVQGLTVTLDDAKQKLGEWTTTVLSAVANSAAALGKMTASSTVAEAGKLLEEVHDKSRIAIEKEIAAMEKLGTVTAREAEKIRNSLALAFGEDIFDNADKDMLSATRRDFSVTDGKTDRGFLEGSPKTLATGQKRDPVAVERALAEAGARIGAKGFGGSKPSAPAAQGPIETPGLSEEDLKQIIEQWNELADVEQKLAADQLESRRLIANEVDLEMKDTFDRFENGERIKQDLVDQTVLVMLEGEARVQAEMEINHDDRVRMINKEKFETEEQYVSAMNAEALLFAEEQKRYNLTRSFSYKINQDMKQIGDTAQQAFASGLADAMVSAFEEGDKAFQKFAANFLRQISEMILQALILRAVQGITGSIFGGGGGGVKGGVSGSGAAFAGYAANGGQFVNKFANGGIAELTSPTYFPNFNVLAGEAGREVMTVLSRPRFERINGVPMQIGYANGNRLAIANADAMSGATGGAGGTARIVVELAPGLVASIKEDSIQGSRVAIVQDMATDTNLSRVTRQKMA